MTTLIEAPAGLDDGCDCSGLLALCGHCACDQCEECGQCAGGEGCACACMDAERSEYEEMWIRKAAERLVRETELYLGTHEIHWLSDKRYGKLLAGLTLFVAIPRLIMRKTPFPKALHKYCIDSGGFSELQKYGIWRLTAREYVALIRRIVGELGPDLCQWVAPQDCMTEQIVIEGGVGRRGVIFKGTREMRGLKPGEPEQDRLTAVAIHQQLTLDNYLELTALAPEIRFIPVLQGQTLEDYERHAQMYRDAGVDLTAAPVVGLGSVCRRQATTEIEEIVGHFHAQGLRLHGFGVKTKGLERYAAKVVTADSLAWSDGAREDKVQLFGCTHKNCASCPFWAYRWHQGIVRRHLSAAPVQMARPGIEGLAAAVVDAHIAHDTDALIAARVEYEMARAATPGLHAAFDAALDARITAMTDALIDDVAAAYGDTDLLAAARDRYGQERDRCPIALHSQLDARLEARLTDLDELTPAA